MAAVDISKKIYVPIDNYIYLYHVPALIILPGYPDNITDSTSVNYSESTSLGRSAPIYSFTGSGPRTMQIDLKVHRESVNLMNYTNSNSIVAPYLNPKDDYVDTLIRLLQAAALPTYADSEKMVDPPLVAVRFGNDIFCKGVINGAVGIDYGPPILKNDKFASVSISFGLKEVDAYDAQMVAQIGSYRNPGDIILNTSLDDVRYSSGSGSSRAVPNGRISSGLSPNRVLTAY